MPRYVILEHAPGAASRAGLHWDLMLEADRVLWTWALPEPPTYGARQHCERLADHRLAYLAYQGAVSGNRGTVAPWDRGDYATLEAADGLLHLRLDGERLHAIARLTRQVDDPQRWVLELSTG